MGTYGIVQRMVVPVLTRGKAADFPHSYKQVYWIYAFRLLKSTCYLQSGTGAEPHALENLRAVASLAAERQDKAVCVLAALLEGLAHLKNMRGNTFERVQACIAQASKHQLDSSAYAPQLEILRNILDLSCSLLQKSPNAVILNQTALQNRLDELKDSANFNDHSSELLLPLRKHAASTSTVSSDTSSVIRPGDGGSSDFLVLESFTRIEAYVLA
jgi:hypothetical protein